MLKIKKKVIIFFLSIFFLNLINANLVIPNQPMDISQTINSESTQQIILTNNYNFKISDFIFSGLSEHGFSFPEIEINPNTTQTIDFTIHTSSSFHAQVTSKVSFKFLVDLPEETITHYINITEHGFNPNYIIIKEGDKIIWTNTDDISHNIFSVSPSMNHYLPINGTKEHIFTSIETVEYYDQDWYGWGEFEGTIEVLNKSTSEKANNPNYDINWILNLNLISNPTNLTIDLSKDTFDIPYNQFKKGLITLTNTGDVTAEIVHLSSSDWISFNKNEFNIEPNEEEWVEYTILPFILNTNQTNRSHELEIKIIATNVEEQIQRINVFIPYKEITDSIENDIGLMIWLDTHYCPKHPCSSFCDPNLPECQGTNGSTIYSDQEVTINVSRASWKEMKKDVAKLKDSGLRSDNSLKIMASKWDLTIPEVLSILNNSVTMQIDNKKELRSNWNAISIIGFFVLLIGITGAVIKIVNKKSYRKYLTEGAFEYRK